MKIKSILIAFLLPYLGSSQVNQFELPKDMPVHNAILGLNPDIQKSSDLKLKLRKEIEKQNSWRKLIQNKKLAIGLMDLTDLSNPVYASINGDHMMYAASLPKIAVLLAIMDALEEGTLKANEEIKTDMRLMISNSNNQATTRNIDRVGFEKIATILQDPRYELYDKNNNGGLWVGKRYAASGKRNPDPLKGLSHAATADQVLRFYKMLCYGELVSPDRSKEMLKIMMNPALHHKFVNTLDQVNPEAKVFRKSGSWKQFHSDSAIVWGEDGKRYILVALIEDANGGQICRELVNVAEKIISPKEVVASVSKD